MSFTPDDTGKSGTRSFDNYVQPVPKEGSRKARIAMIVDLGTQERADFEDKITGDTRPQTPVQQVAVFADLVADLHDYGGMIGKAPIRLPLNKVFMGQFTGWNFNATPPRDNDGKIIPGRKNCLHPTSPLTKLCKAVGKPEVVESLDISTLLNVPFMAQVVVDRKEHKEGKIDEKTGEVIVYTNVGIKGYAQVPTMEDDNGVEVMIPVAELKQPALAITFKNAKKEDIKWIRPSLLKTIKLAKNYAGSKMQEAIEAYEAEQPAPTPAESKPATKTVEKKVTSPKTKAPVTGFDDMDDDTPF